MVCSMVTLKNGNGFWLPKWLYLYWKILGVCPIVFDENNIIIYKKRELFYAVLLTLTYILLYVRVAAARLFLGQPHETLSTITADFLGLSMEFLTIITSWMFFAFRQSELKKIVEIVKLINASLKSSGIHLNSDDSIRRLKVSTIFMNLLWIVLYFSDHCFIFDHKTFLYDVWLPFNIPRIVSHNVVIMYVNSLLTMKKIFHLLNKSIEDLNRDTGLVLRFPQRLRKPMESHTKLGSLLIYGQLHSDLVTLTKNIVHFFSLCIILAILGHLYLMASDLYMLCMVAKDNVIWNHKKIIPFLVICFWLAFHVGETVLVVAISDSTAREANRAGKVLHQMLTNSRNVEIYACTAELLSLRLLHKRLTISLWGLLRMRLSIVHTILGTVVTYITIMMQFDGQNV